MIETIKQTVSSGFEFVIALKLVFNSQTDITHKTEASNEAVGAMNIVQTTADVLQRCEVLLDLVLSKFALPVAIKGVFLYYKFKRCQLMAGAYQLGTAVSNNKAESIQWLSRAADLWVQMVAFNFYGSQYVLADPDKEYAAVLSELAMLLCLQAQFEEGLEVYLTSINVQKETLLGYGSIRIATNDVIQVGWVILVETYINAAVCSSQHGTSISIFNGIEFITQAKEILGRFNVPE